MNHPSSLSLFFEKEKTVKANQAKAPEQKLQEQPCLICGRQTIGYGTWRTGVTCSRVCEGTQEAKSKTLQEGEWK